MQLPEYIADFEAQLANAIALEQQQKNNLANTQQLIQRLEGAIQATRLIQQDSVEPPIQLAGPPGPPGLKGDRGERGLPAGSPAEPAELIESPNHNILRSWSDTEAE